jgi:hypothetical protein
VGGIHLMPRAPGEQARRGGRRKKSKKFKGGFDYTSWDWEGRKKKKILRGAGWTEARLRVAHRCSPQAPSSSLSTFSLLRRRSRYRRRRRCAASNRNTKKRRAAVSCKPCRPLAQGNSSSDAKKIHSIHQTREWEKKN